LIYDLELVRTRGHAHVVAYTWRAYQGRQSPDLAGGKSLLIRSTVWALYATLSALTQGCEDRFSAQESKQQACFLLGYCNDFWKGSDRLDLESTPRLGDVWATHDSMPSWQTGDASIHCQTLGTNHSLDQHTSISKQGDCVFCTDDGSSLTCNCHATSREIFKSSEG